MATLRSGTFYLISSCHAAILKSPFHETLVVFTFYRHKLIVQATYSDAGAVDSDSPGGQNSPLRREYPTEKMSRNEILSHLSKVWDRTFVREL